MALTAGARLGSYEIVAPLGSGGMGDVYEAVDSNLDRHIAIKVLADRLAADADALRRFQREARAVAALNHPNIVTIHSVEEADGVHFLTMELVDGQPLDRLIADNALALERFFDVATALADALAAAHARGITHRDLKPANVMMTADGRVKVLDFGLAKVQVASSDLAATVTKGAAPITSEGMVVGTFPYMSPEQIEGKPVDHRSDIFSLGVVLYELLAGRRPFGGDTAPALMSAILRDTPPSVSAIRAELPDSVAAPIQHCLEKSPGSRYQTAAELHRDLAAAQLRHTSNTGAGAPASAEADKSIAVLPFTNMSADPENEFFSDGISEEIINALTQIDDLHVAARTSAFSFKGKNVDLREVAEKLNVATVLEGSVRKAGTRLRITAQLVNAADGYHLWSERYDRELEDVFAIQDEIARTIAERLKATLTGEQEETVVKPATDNLEAYQLYLKGRALLYQRGKSIPPALECLKQAVDIDDNYALAWAGLADAYTTLGFYGFVPPDDAIPLAKTAAARAVDLDDTLAEAHGALGGAALMAPIDLELAEREFVRALELNPGFIQARGWYALFYLAMIRGRAAEALEHSADMVARDPLSGYVWSIHSFTLVLAGRHGEAIDAALEAIERDSDSFIAHWALQSSYYIAGRLPEAIVAGHAALAGSARHPWAVVTQAAAYKDKEKRADASALHDELIERASTGYVQSGVLAWSAALAGLDADAIGYAERAVDDRDPLFPLILGHWPHTEPLRHVLREAGRFDDIRHSLGLTSKLKGTESQ